ncbi:hypothetical protein FE257_012215 [Aspergillus nanangensis]|uniref:Oxidase FUB9 n=1 Tax=Aspergillus nanangensis TaxID=2582783 RepID=A0AAD4GQW3_ASPNN|nr:hypothetical protein FE257_012215 [Aspergillus nanangensis]
MTKAPLHDIMLCINDIKEAAGTKLPISATDFYNSGSTNQVTVTENTTAYRKYRLRPRVLVDVSQADPSTTVFGQKIRFPLGVSPAGLQGMAHPDGELATSRACAKHGVAMGVSTFANYTVEEIRAAGLDIGPIPHCMQIYTMQDRTKQESILKRAEAAGCVALFLTADSPILGFRYNEHRNDFRSPEGLAFPMMDRTSEMIRSERHEDGFTAFNSSSHSWAREIPWLRSITKMQIWIKGVLTAEDVELAVQYGCDGVLVSNHGGRQLDETPATIDALPECVKAANGKIPVHIDGGIRSGTDIFKALALGAECCWIGRPMIWGLAYGGEAGANKVLDILYNEFMRCMQLTGCRSVADISHASLGILFSYVMSPMVPNLIGTRLELRTITRNTKSRVILSMQELATDQFILVFFQEPKRHFVAIMQIISSALTFFATALLFGQAVAHPSDPCNGRTIWADTTDCHAFYQCGAVGEPVHKWCAPGTGFNPHTNACERQEYVCK